MAGIYNVLLGGNHGQPEDQQAATDLLQLVSDAVTAAYQNREFVACAVRFLAGQAGISQFIDIGTGMPARKYIHEFIPESAPSTQVLYVDCDPAVVARGQAVVAGNPSARMIHGDLHHPGEIVGHPDIRSFINLYEPVAVLLTGVLHFVEDARLAVAAVSSAIAPGSYVVVSHATHDEMTPEVTRGVSGVYRRTGSPLVLRTRGQIANMLDGLELISPGLVNGAAWRPGHQAPEPRRTLFYAGIGRTH